MRANYGLRYFLGYRNMSKCFERIENLMGPGLEISLLTYHRLRYQLVNGSIMNSQAIRNLFQGRSQTYGVRVGYMDLPFHQRNNLQHELDFLLTTGNCVPHVSDI